MSGKPLRDAVYRAAQQAHQVCARLNERLARPPAVACHSDAQRVFMHFMKKKCGAFIDQVLAIGARVDRPDEELDRKLINDCLDKCKDIMTDVAALTSFAKNVGELGVFDMPSPLILWIQETFREILGQERHLLIGRIEDDDFRVMLMGIGPGLKALTGSVAQDSAECWPIAQFPATRPHRLFDLMLLYHEMMHPVFVEKMVMGTAVKSPEADTIWAKVSAKAASLAKDAAKQRPGLFAGREKEGWTKYWDARIKEVMRRWAREIFCDLAAAAVAGPSYLIGMMLFDYDLPARESKTGSLSETHPPMGYRHALVFEALVSDKLGWKFFVEEIPAIKQWINEVRIADGVLREKPAEPLEERAIKFAYRLLEEHYLSGLGAAAFDVAKQLPFAFVSRPDTAEKIWKQAKARLSEGVVPFVYLPDSDIGRPLDIVNASARFMMCGDMEAEWRQYEAKGGRARHLAKLCDKLHDLTLKSLEDSLLVYIFERGAK